MQKVILVKLGGSLITDKGRPFSEKIEVIRRLSREIHKARKKKGLLLIVGHGGGSYPHVPAVNYQTARGVINKQSYRGISEVQDAAARLNRIVVKELITIGENAVSVAPSSFMMTASGKINKAFLAPLLQLLKFGMLPVVFGDVVLDSKQGCCILSTETILNYLAIRLKGKFKVAEVIHCGITDGVYGLQGATLPKITPKNFAAIKTHLKGSAGIDVTGGMLHKVEECVSLTGQGLFSRIINGAREGELFNVLMGKPRGGTRICNN